MLQLNVIPAESSSSSVNAAVSCQDEELQFNSYLLEAAASTNAASTRENEELHYLQEAATSANVAAT